jgi:uncharacterized protein (DUF1330 family)
MNKYKGLVKKGYKEEKAFGIVEAELCTVLDEQRDEIRILRGAALSEHGNSYLDRAQKVAELESQLKMQRYVRDIPKFERTTNAQSWLDESTEQNETERDSVEDMLYEKLPVKSTYDHYEPVLYKIVKEPSQLKATESPSQEQRGFVDRTERLLRMHQQRSHIHDGLRILSDEDVIQKVTQCPTKLKAKAKRFLTKLQENGVTLDNNGEIEWGNVDPNVVNQLKDKE